MVRTIVTIAVAACLVSLDQARASSQSPAEAFVQQGADGALRILRDGALNDVQRNDGMQSLMSSFLDLKRMALFTLGSAARTASASDTAAFVSAYRDFALANYTTELSAYMGESLQITGSSERAAGDFIVNAEVIDPNHKAETPTPVSFRVLDEGAGKYALVDASVAGVWFTLAQRDDFSGFLGQNGGDITKLAAHLKDLSAHARPGGEPAR
jgi:phospholipid transport system substrate-binding protein